MIERILAALAGFIVSVISSTGYFGVLILMAIESACIPLPSEIIMPFSGYLVYTGRFSLFWVATAGALGCNLGSWIAYEIGAYGGRPMVMKYGHYIFLTEHEIAWADRFFDKYGDWAILISRMLPVIRTFIALPAGIARMRRLHFHVFTFIGSWPWCFMLAWVGMKLGERWETDPRLKMWFHRLDAVIAAVIVIAVLAFLWTRWKGRIKAQPSAS
jgi:membrane protein DedA with SNARE-associated domain